MILITGATGLIGRTTARLLLDGGHEEVAGVTRDPARAGLLPSGVRAVHGDPSDPKSSAAALPLSDVDAILLAPRAVGAGLAGLLSLAARAAADGGRPAPRAVLVSAVTVEYGGGYARFAEEFRAAEKAVRDSGLPWTVLRSADFAANTLAWAPQIQAAGAVRGAYAGAATAAVHELDLAEVAAQALATDRHVGRTYALTGPEALSQSTKARLIGEALGREVPFIEVEPEQVRAALLAQGVPADVPDRMLGYQRACLAEPGPTTQDVETVLGRPARSFAAWAREHAERFTAAPDGIPSRRGL